MHEDTPGDRLPAPRQHLVSLLETDFTQPDAREIAQPSNDNALTSLITRVQPVEEIDARLSSEENVQLGHSVEELLAPAPVTTSFKAYVANEVRQAHAWKSKVGGAVSPGKLGILSGEGIFDPKQAGDIEAQMLRGYAFDIVHRYTVAPTAADEADLPPLLLKPGMRPSDFTEAVDRFYEWIADYRQMYGNDPFEGLEQEAYLDAVPQAEMMPEGELGSTGWNHIAERLKQLRDKSEKQ